MPETKYVFPGYTVYVDRTAKELEMPLDGVARNQAIRIPAIHGLGSLIGQASEKKVEDRRKIFEEALKYYDAITLAYHASIAMVEEARQALFPAPPAEQPLVDGESDEEWDIDDDRDTQFRQVDPQPAKRRKGK